MYESDRREYNKRVKAVVEESWIDNENDDDEEGGDDENGEEGEEEG